MQIAIVGLNRRGGNMSRRFALMMRFASQGKSDYADRLLAPMRKGFGSYAVEAKAPKP